jgi:hypothetical protein
MSGLGRLIQEKPCRLVRSFRFFPPGDVALRYNSYWTGSTWKYLNSSFKASQIFIDSAGQHFWTSNTSGTADGVVPDLTERLTITSGGNVGVNTTSPQYQLSVNGTIQAKEVLVNTGWPDYVFSPDYRIKPLSEIAEFIKANHHLPDIPSEAEVKEKGVSLGDMQSKLLLKIEELTLHMIEVQHKNQELQEKVARLERRYGPQSESTGAMAKGLASSAK